MKATTAIAVAWIAVAMAVIVTVDKTGSMKPLWFFLIPSILSTTSTSREDTEDKETE